MPMPETKIQSETMQQTPRRRSNAELSKIQKRAQFYRRSSIATISVTVCGVVAGLIISAFEPKGSSIGLSLAAICFWGGLTLFCFPFTLVHDTLMKDAINSPSLDGIGVIIDAACEGLLAPYDIHKLNGSGRESAPKILAVMLPKMQANDANLLTARQYVRLCCLLASYYTPPELALAILKALEQIGDSAAIPYVEAVIRREAATGYNERVQQAAQECLPFLIERARREGVSDTLLRASEVPMPAETLLRPARSGQAEEPQMLLRVPESRADAD